MGKVLAYTGIFDAVVCSVSAMKVADCNALSVNRSGFSRCPFHNEKTASFKIYNKAGYGDDTGYYCYGCHASGDAIDLHANLNKIGRYDAAKELSAIFGLDGTWKNATEKEIRFRNKQKYARLEQKEILHKFYVSRSRKIAEDERKCLSIIENAYSGNEFDYETMSEEDLDRIADSVFCNAEFIEAAKKLDSVGLENDMNQSVIGDDYIGIKKWRDDVLGN